MSASFSNKTHRKDELEMNETGQRQGQKQNGRTGGKGTGKMDEWDYL